MIIAIVMYAAAMTLANLSVAAFGPAISPINSFFLIGLDLSLRDWLHVRLKAWQMAVLIATSGCITYILNPSAGAIAIASAVSFTAAALVDWAFFIRMTGSWLKRSNQSNLVGATVDSILFPTIAFGVLMPGIVLMQFVAKVAGGAIWSVVFDRFMRKDSGT